MTGIEFFLTKQIYGRVDHPKGWEKYLYDDEVIHYGLLQILFECCPEFVERLLRSSSPAESVKVTLKPDNGTLDMLTIVNGEPFYLEVKIWSHLTLDQFDRQVEYIKGKNAQGFYILFFWAADEWSSERVLERSNGCCRLISRNDLMEALSAVRSFSHPEVAEIADAYKSVLRDIERRW